MTTIRVRVVAKGEPEALPLVRVFEYHDATEELILQHSVKAVQEKLAKGMKINVNEALLLYADYVIAQVRAKKDSAAIARGARQVLSAEQLMIGVSETLRTMAFDAQVDDADDDCGGSGGGRRTLMTVRGPSVAYYHYRAMAAVAAERR